jgi:hypothetical protein
MENECRLCKGKIRKDNSHKICSSNPECRRYYRMVARSGGDVELVDGKPVRILPPGARKPPQPQPKPKDKTCAGCGGPLRIHSKYGYCRKTPECARAYRSAMWRATHPKVKRVKVKGPGTYAPGSRVTPGPAVQAELVPTAPPPFEWSEAAMENELLGVCQGMDPEGLLGSSEDAVAWQNAIARQRRQAIDQKVSAAC